MQASSTPSPFPLPISFPSPRSTLRQTSATHLDPGTAEGAALARPGPGPKAAQTRRPWLQDAAEWLGDYWSGDPSSAKQTLRRELPGVLAGGRDPPGGQQASRLPANLQFNATEAHCPAGLRQNAGSREPRDQRVRASHAQTNKECWLPSPAAGAVPLRQHNPLLASQALGSRLKACLIK